MVPLTVEMFRYMGSWATNITGTTIPILPRATGPICRWLLSVAPSGIPRTSVGGRRANLIPKGCRRHCCLVIVSETEF